MKTDYSTYRKLLLKILHIRWEQDKKKLSVLRGKLTMFVTVEIQKSCTFKKVTGNRMHKRQHYTNV